MGEDVCRKSVKKKVNIIYYNDEGFILFERGNLSLECILRSYDDIVKIVDFEKGLLTVLMKRKDKTIEEYVDFEAVLHDINLSKEKEKYFKDIKLEDMVLKRSAVYA